MRYLHVRLTGEDVELHPLVPTLADGDVFRDARMVDWAQSSDPLRATVLLYLDGDLERFEDTLAESPIVLEYDLTRVGDGRGYAYVVSDAHPTEKLLYDAFTDEGLLPVSPIQYHRDGSLSLRIVGPDDRLQRAVERIPDGVETAVERVGEYDLARPPIPRILPARQHEALAAAFEAGYYEVPREATREDVAERLDCAPSTASEHLRKAEARLVGRYLNRRA